MVKIFRAVLLLLISYLILSKGSVRAEIDTSMIGVKKYQKFDYLQTKFIGNYHPSFQIDLGGNILFPDDLLSHDDHIFSLKIKEITTIDTTNSILSCEYSRADIITDSLCHLDGLLQDSPFVYIDWEYWIDYLQGIVSARKTTFAFEFINDDNLFGYTWDYLGFDPFNYPFFGNISVTAVYDKRIGNMLNFSRTSTDSEQGIENGFAYQFVSVSMNYNFENIFLYIYGLIGFLIIILILIYLIYRKRDSKPSEK